MMSDALVLEFRIGLQNLYEEREVGDDQHPDTNIQNISKNVQEIVVWTVAELANIDKQILHEKNVLRFCQDSSHLSKKNWNTYANILKNIENNRKFY